MAVENRYPLNQVLPIDSHLFQRPRNSVGLKLRNQKKIIRARHIIIFFLGLALLFFGLAEAYYYVITCEQLKINQVEVSSPSAELKQTVENYFQGRNLGNILLCNLNYLRLSLSSIPGVKEVRMEKILPSTLKVEVFPRIPRVYLFQSGYYHLADEEGMVIKSFAQLPDDLFPVIEDEENFVRFSRQKVQTAYRMLESLREEARTLVKRIRFQKTGLMEVELDGDPVRLYLEEDNFAEQLNYYLSNRETWTNQFGPLEYVDLRIEGRAYLKPLTLSASNSRVQKKEVS
jgi:cell division septal protein FtsQ